MRSFIAPLQPDEVQFGMATLFYYAISLLDDSQLEGDLNAPV
jgi:hypothetical protein